MLELETFLLLFSPISIISFQKILEWCIKILESFLGLQFLQSLLINVYIQIPSGQTKFKSAEVRITAWFLARCHVCFPASEVLGFDFAEGTRMFVLFPRCVAKSLRRYPLSFLQKGVHSNKQQQTNNWKLGWTKKSEPTTARWNGDIYVWVVHRSKRFSGDLWHGLKVWKLARVDKSLPWGKIYYSKIYPYYSRLEDRFTINIFRAKNLKKSWFY